MTGSHCLTAAALPGDPPIEWLDGRLTGKEKRWRRENGRCLNMRCRYPGHLAEMCSSAINVARGGECAEDNGMNESALNYFRPRSSSPNKAFQTYPVTNVAY